MPKQEQKNSQFVNVRFVILQALFWGKMSGPEIYKYFKKECGENAYFSRHYIWRALKWLRDREYVELESKVEEEGLMFTVKETWRITNIGRIELITAREFLKVIFTTPPEQFRINPLADADDTPEETSPDNQ